MNKILLLLKSCIQIAGVDTLAVIIGITSGPLKRRKAVIVLELKVRWKLLRCCSSTISKTELLHEHTRIMREEAGVSSNAVALQPVFADVVLYLMCISAISTSTRPASQPIPTHSR